MLSLAVFYFVFLGTEYLFDNRMAVCTDPAVVVLAQSYILGVSALGFLAYSLIEKWKSKSGNLTESTLQNRNKFSILKTKTKYSQQKGRSNAAFLRYIS